MVEAAPSVAIAFFGTPRFAVPTLEALIASRHHVVAALTQPDRPRGRGQHASPSPVKQVALAAGIPVLQPERLRDEAFLRAFRETGAELGVVAAYGKILPDVLLAIPRLGLINVHASLLPKYRGAAPVHRAVMAGEPETGVTIMRVVRELDAGPTFDGVRRPIGPDETSDIVEQDLARMGAPLLVHVVDAIAGGTSREVPQIDREATYAPRITREEGAVDWSRPAATLHNQVRGLYPWPHAFTGLDGERLILLRTTLANGGSTDVLPGTILEARGGTLRVAAGQGALDILELQAEGRKPLAARQFLAGRPLRPGDRFASITTADAASGKTPR